MTGDPPVSGEPGGVEQPLLVVEGLSKRFRIPRSRHQRSTTFAAVDAVSFCIRRGEVWGLVGESGSGKSTTANLVLRLQEPNGGRIVFDGQDLTALRGEALRRLRPRIQPVFQDVAGSLNPLRHVEDLISEPLQVHQDLAPEAQRAAVAEAIARVELEPRHLARYPHQLSGGQRQRVALARALILKPDLLVLDEPTSALDVSTRARVLRLLLDIKAQGTALFVVSHDLNFMRHLCDRIAVMYSGEIVEEGAAAEIATNPRHPYSQLLVAATPQVTLSGPPKAQERQPAGDALSLHAVPSGCRFHPRCPYAEPRCRTDHPARHDADGGRSVSCHLFDPGRVPPTSSASYAKPKPSTMQQ